MHTGANQAIIHKNCIGSFNGCYPYPTEKEYNVCHGNNFWKIGEDDFTQKVLSECFQNAKAKRINSSISGYIRPLQNYLDLKLSSTSIMCLFFFGFKTPIFFWKNISRPQEKKGNVEKAK